MLILILAVGMLSSGSLRPLALLQHHGDSRNKRRPGPDDTLGRTLGTLYAVGVTALYSLMAATVATRVGLAPTFAPRDRTSGHGDGRYHSDEAPEAHVMPRPRGSSRAQRPALNQGRLDLVVAHQAGMLELMQPRSGKSSAAHDVGQLIPAPMTPLQRT